MEYSKAQIELLGLHAKAERLDEYDFVTELTNKGLLQEIITRLQELYHTVTYIAGQTISIGKIIIMKLLEFIQANPNMVIGLAVGIGLTALSGMIASMVPWIGSFLAPIAMAITSLIVIPIGALRGHRLDKAINNEGHISDSLIEDIITVAKRFWALFVEIMGVIQDNMKVKE